ncbi:hypothetical protein D1007_28978 [Hordeum vulgare]|uniref:Predicted protein n=1 Tax=Hordeum vulgare subsp. vulgare TaxID=112509 RepID=F2DNB5_HORVV|nr:uncharacterized protein LOC123409020 [Hordeum vulgare subsp. vulgare]KAE8796118.1 hypothetical protein D1007_28978 [Hordeum vulgare]KAI4972097.1 hypothetical protein ZWY2020_003022 [Hordeum vulgare]BAJ96586.1 predicted protein [Hordeum vulgare subsp. vulgare]BAJ97925.1 predicted protein [Hordeum vulgare subsp. vulgare]
MDRQSLRVGGAGDAQELCYVGSRQAEVDGGAFLMELLEDTTAPEAADDRLRRVMRSLEAELGIASAPAPAAAEDGESTADGPMSDDDDGGLEDMLSELEGSLGGEAPSLATVLPLEYWEEVAPVMGGDMGGWYVDGEGLVAGYEYREPCCYNNYAYGEGSAVEQVYSPLCLWE